jgi:hypothetical protein
MDRPPKRCEYASPAWPPGAIPCIDADDHGGEDVPKYLCAISRLWHDLTCMTKGALIDTARSGGVYVGQEMTRAQVALRIMTVAEAAMVRWAAVHPEHYCLRAFAVTALSMDDVLEEGCLGLLGRRGAWVSPTSFERVLPMFRRAERSKVMSCPPAATAAACAWLDAHGGVHVDWSDARCYAYKCPTIEFLVPPAGTDLDAWEGQGRLSYRDVSAALRLFRDWASDGCPRAEVLVDVANRLIACLGRKRADCDPSNSQAVREASEAVAPHLQSLLDRVEKSLVASGADCFANHLYHKYKGAYAEVARDLVGNAPLLRMGVELNRAKRKVAALEAELGQRSPGDGAGASAASAAEAGACGAFAPGTRVVSAAIQATPLSAEAPN